MGFTFAADRHTDGHHTNGLVNGFSENSAFSYHIDCLAAVQNTHPTGMREDVLLLSWLIVLLRTREGSQVFFDWAYARSLDIIKHQSASDRLSMDKIMEGLQDDIKDVSAAISKHISTTGLRDFASGTATSLLLSTGSLSQEFEGPEVCKSICLVLA